MMHLAHHRGLYVIVALMLFIAKEDIDGFRVCDRIEANDRYAKIETPE
jgi:hypothetical protein